MPGRAQRPESLLVGTTGTGVNPTSCSLVAGAGSTVTAVLHLLNLCCPATIRRFVVAVIVHTVKAVSGTGSQAHIGDERVERCAPALAHRDTSPAVVPIIWMSRLITASDHGVPAVILGPPWATASGCSLFDKIEEKAATTHSGPAFERTLERSACPGDRGAAIAATQPVRPGVVALTNVFDHEQTADSLASHVYPEARLPSHHVLHWRGVRPATVSPVRRSSHCREVVA
jgi:hypothetical protein